MSFAAFTPRSQCKPTWHARRRRRPRPPRRRRQRRPPRRRPNWRNSMGGRADSAPVRYSPSIQTPSRMSAAPSPRRRLRNRRGRRWRGRRRPLHACLRRFRAGDFAAGADSDDESAQQVWMEMARHANCNPKSRTLNPSSMMQADSSATSTEPVAASIHLRRFRDSDLKNSVTFACCDPWCPRPRSMRHVSHACSCAAPKFRRIQRPFLRSEFVLVFHIRAGSTCGSAWS